MNRSKLICDRFKGCLHNGEIENTDLVNLFSYIAKDILNLQTRTSYGKEHGKCYNAHQWAKGERIEIKGHEFIVDNK